PFFYFIMEFVDGANLRQALLAKTLEPKQALAIVPQICDALQYAHDEGIVHRDIKPENVLLDKKGRVKIADFGLAKLLQKTPLNYTLTQTYVTMGTPHYMAPEQTERPLEVDHRADIYSLGVVFYEMLTGELPLGRFAAPSQKSQCDARLDDVVFKTLEKEPGRRYQQASEVKTGVQEASASPPPASGASDPQPVLPYAQHHPQHHAQPYRQYSRVAYAGAIWGAVGLASLALLTILGGVGGRGVVMIFALPFVLFALSALIGMPLCGLIAISQIHRSNGQITGLRLATFDALAYPLLIFNAILLAGLWLMPTRALDLSKVEALLILAVLGLPVCAVLDFFIVRFLWRRISAGMPEHPAWRPTIAGAAAAAESEQPTRSGEAPVVPYGEGSRYSRTALCGAVWAVVGLLGPVLILAAYLFAGQSGSRAVAVATSASTTASRTPTVPGAPAPLQPAPPIDASSNMSDPLVEPDGRALPGSPITITVPPTSNNATGTSRITMGGGGRQFAQVTVTATPAPLWLQIAGSLKLAMFPLLAIAFTAPFGATILGLVAINQIRQSRGRLYGMPLALFDTLLYPLLLLDTLIVGGMITTGAVAVSRSMRGEQRAIAVVLIVVVSVIIAIAADVWIVRRVRDAATSGAAAG
ncbi:MAG: serine/threonine-protein kinase, partial [Tepidisphaeraceae bacterium]